MIKKKAGTKKYRMSTKTKENQSSITQSNAESKPFLMVGIGASAGGLEALKLLLQALPKRIGFSLVIIQHLDPTHQSDLTKILSGLCALPVSEVKNGTRPQPDHIYIIPPNRNLALAGGAFKLSLRSEIQKFNLSVDLFFRSLAEAYKSQAIGIVLSGTGSDGTQGLLAIKAEGGITFAQDPKSAKFDSMPKSAIASGAVDFVLPPEGIADELLRISQHPYVFSETSSVKKPALNGSDFKLHNHDKALDKIFALLRKLIRVDFSGYKRTTILRRLSRRLLVLKIADLESYATYIEAHPEEAKMLFADILIHVTRFFRDSEAYEALKNKILPQYIKQRDTATSFRVWVPGCSTGEEAYSIAIILLEYFEKVGLHIPIQIFASDISEHALKKARSGVYGDIEQDVSKERLRRFFEKVDAGYRINKRIREICLFSKHDVTGDPPFAKVDIISCRNLLIYFSADVQKKVLPIFHYALNSNAILWLGNSETTGDSANLFTVADKTHKIYFKKNITTPRKLQFSFLAGLPEKSASHYASPISKQGQFDVQKESDRIALLEYVPPSVVVNEAMEILQVRGRTAPFLELAEGQASLKLLKMARPELVSELRSIIQMARKQKKTVKKKGLRILGSNGPLFFNLKVVPISLPSTTKEHCYSIFFEKLSPTEPAATMLSETKGKTKKTTKKVKSSKSLHADHTRNLSDLQNQLTASHEYQQSLIEDYETSQEELTASNEELQSTNEELQSSNEELETAKEELESTNEELTTVNDELNTRNSEMKQLTNDLTNLLSSVEIPVVMVGPDAKIRRFTPRAAKILKLIPTDIGRSIGDIKPDVGVLNLDELVTEVMDSMLTKDIETQDRAGVWYRLQIKPYRTAENKIDGAVIMLIDIDTLKHNIQELKSAHEDAATIIESMPIPLLVVSENKKIKMANKSFYEKFKVTRPETEGVAITELGNGQWNVPELLKVLDKTIKENIKFDKFEITHKFPNIGKKIMLLNATSVRLPGSGTNTALLAIEDITEARQNEQMLRFSEEKYRNLVSSLYDGIMLVCGDGTIEFVNPQLEKMFGYATGELLNKKYDLLILEKDREKHLKYHNEYMINPIARDMGKSPNIFGRRKDGSEMPLAIALSPVKINSEVKINCTIRDITEQKKLSEALNKLLVQEKILRDESEKTNRIKDEFLATLSHELRTPLTAILGWAQELRADSVDQKIISEGLAVIERSAQAQGQLINDLLDISRIQSGKLALDLKDIDLIKILDMAIDSVRKSAEKKSINIKVDLATPTCEVFADGVRMQQVFWNLLTNAIKFTHQGGNIFIKFKIIDAPNDKSADKQTVKQMGKQAQIQITDTGLGIKPEFLTQIFQRFSQADSSTTRSYGGMGLGLAIVRSLVEMQNGTVTAESKGEGQGATFTVTLPLIVIKNKIVDETKRAATNVIQQRLDGLKILAVDDNTDNRMLFSIILKSLGAEVKLAESVAEAMKILNEFKPDIILSDISMPDEDGYGLLRRIKDREAGQTEKTPVVALTAHASIEDATRMLEAGFSAHVAKPVDRKILANTIFKLTAKPKA